MGIIWNIKNKIKVNIQQRYLLEFGQKYLNEILQTEFDNQNFDSFNERPIEYAFVFRQLARYYPATILDVGTGTTALPHLMRNCCFQVTAIDNIRDYWPEGMVNRHFHVIDDDITNTKINQQFDFITCISVLEHIKDHKSAVKNMFSLLKSGGHLILTCPYTEDQYVENVYNLPDSSARNMKIPFTTQAFSRRELENWLRINGGRIVEQEYWRFFDGKHWTVGECVVPPLKVGKDEGHQITCLLIQKL